MHKTPNPNNPQTDWPIQPTRQNKNYDVYCASSVINNPAIAALVNVLTAPVSIALNATREISPARDGASCASTPIWLPREPMLAKPQRA